MANLLLYSTKFDSDLQAIPDIAEDKFVINVYNPSTLANAANSASVIKVNDVELQESTY